MITANVDLALVLPQVKKHKVLLSSCAVFCFVLFGMFAAGRAYSEPLDAYSDKESIYRVHIEVSPEFEPLLSANLEIVQWADSPRMNNAFFRVLFDESEQHIKNLLSTEGYFSPVIKGELEDTGGVVIAVFTIDHGEPSRISLVKLDYTGTIRERSETLPGPEQVMSAWPLDVGDIFRQPDWERAKREVLREFIRYNYPAASIRHSRAEVDSERGEVVIDIVVDSGPFVTLGELQISGLETYPKEIILNRNFIKPGTPHTKGVLLSLQNVLEDSGYFNSVVVFVDIDSSAPEMVPIMVAVREKKSKSILAGVRLNSNTGLGASLEYADINFLGRGVQWRNKLQADQFSWQARTEFSLVPDSQGNVYSLFTSFASEDIEGIKSDVSRTGIARARRYFNSGLVTSLHFEEERRRAGGVSDSLQTLVLDNSWHFDRLDNPLFPSQGYMVNLKLGGALKEILAERSFVRGLFRANIYHSLSPVDVIIINGEAGLVAAGESEGVPSEYLFRTGGAHTVRGFPYLGLGVEEDGVVKGGRYMGVFSVEYNRWLHRNFAVALFSDWGNATDSLSDVRMAQGLGAGIRLRSPVGIFKFDCAYGKDRAKLAWHVAMGVAF